MKANVNPSRNEYSLVFHPYIRRINTRQCFQRSELVVHWTPTPARVTHAQSAVLSVFGGAAIASIGWQIGFEEISPLTVRAAAAVVVDVVHRTIKTRMAAVVGRGVGRQAAGVISQVFRRFSHCLRSTAI